MLPFMLLSFQFSLLIFFRASKMHIQSCKQQPGHLNTRALRAHFEVKSRLFFKSIDRSLLFFENKLLPDKWFLSLLKDFMFTISMRGNTLTAKGLSFQMISIHCQSVSFSLEVKSFVVKRKNIISRIKEGKLYDWN